LENTWDASTRKPRPGRNTLLDELLEKEERREG
jgi:hypothetical protein